jgi:effector-binding domain-containing protein
MTQFALVTLTPQPFAYVSRECALAEIGQIMSEGFGAAFGALARAGAAPAGEPMAHYRSVKNGRVSVDIGVPIRAEAEASARAAGLEVGATGAGRAVQAMHVGPYDTLTQTYDAMFADMRARSLAPADDMWERYLDPPDTPAEKVRTEVIWPVRA